MSLNGGDGLYGWFSSADDLRIHAFLLGRRYVLVLLQCYFRQIDAILYLAIRL